MRRCLGHVVPGDDEVPEAVRERTYQKYPNPIYEMGWVLINILDRNRLRGGSVVERYVDLSARSCTIAPDIPAPSWKAENGGQHSCYDLAQCTKPQVDSGMTPNTAIFGNAKSPLFYW